MDVNAIEQEEELTALEAILQNEFKLNDNSTHGEKCFSVDIKVILPQHVNEILLQAWIPVENSPAYHGDDSLELNTNERNEESLSGPGRAAAKIQRSQSQNHWLTEQNVRYLPPIHFNCKFPLDYPSNTPPEFTLSCSWLRHEQLTRVCYCLDKLWEDTPFQPIIYSWIDWLQNSLIESLNVDEDGIVLNDNEIPDKYDPRAVREEASVQDILIDILENDFKITKEQFQLGNHTCEVCFEEKDGRQFMFLECGHVYCNECLRAFCELHTQNGTVENLYCPNTDCNMSLSPFIIQELLSSEQYQRWEQFMLQKSLDKMLDLLYCPRCNQAVICDESEDNLGQCASCFFAFCTECLQSWHQGVPCYNTDGQSSKLEKSKAQVSKRATGLHYKVNPPEWKGSGGDSKAFIMMQLYCGKFKKCPKCKVVIEKNQGCPHMYCSRCRTNFCWTCGRIMDMTHGHSCTPGSSRALQNLQPVPEGLLRVKKLEEESYEKKEFKSCPKCRQKNARENRNNHMKCWCCKSNFCFQCRKIITGNISMHFTGSGSCQQHTD